MKTTKLSIPKLNNMEPSVHNFTRYEKVQVEYVLLKFLTKLLQPKHGDLGYKGMYTMGATYLVLWTIFIENLSDIICLHCMMLNFTWPAQLVQLVARLSL